MDSDLSTCKIGDMVAIEKGWVSVSYIDRDYIETENGYRFTLDGKHILNGEVPSCFIVPPFFWLDFIGPKPIPCPFKKNDKVLCIVDGVIKRRYFSHEANGDYYCFDDGDEWMSRGNDIIYAKEDVYGLEDNIFCDRCGWELAKDDEYCPGCEN